MNEDMLDYVMNYGQMSESEREQKLFELKNMYGGAALKEEMYAIKNTYNTSISKKKQKKSSNHKNKFKKK